MAEKTDYASAARRLKSKCKTGSRAKRVIKAVKKTTK